MQIRSYEMVVLLQDHALGLIGVVSLWNPPLVKCLINIISSPSSVTPLAQRLRHQPMPVPLMQIGMHNKTGDFQDSKAFRDSQTLRLGPQAFDIKFWLLYPNTGCDNTLDKALISAICGNRGLRLLQSILIESGIIDP